MRTFARSERRMGLQTPAMFRTLTFIFRSDLTCLHLLLRLLQFFTAVSVFALVLVCTSVFMTQKPPWMEGKEADLGVSSPFIPPDAPAYLYNDEQMRDMQEPEAAEKARPQALSQVTGRPLSGKAAVEAAAANPGGIMLMYYNMVN